MCRPRDELRVCMTVLGQKGGMDSIAELIIQTIEQRADSRIHVTRLLTRGSGGIFHGSLLFAAALMRFWLAGLRGQIDVLHLNVAAGGSAYRKLILARVARHLGIPYVVHLHGSRFHEFWPSIGPYARGAVNRLFEESARILVLGRFWARLVADRVAGTQSKIEIFPNATRRLSVEREQSSDQSVHISCLGLLGPRKGTPQVD